MQRLRRPLLKVKKVNKDELYRLIAKMYGFTYDQIANMNRFQQLSLLSGDTKVHFNSYEDYMKWKQTNG
jgi:hypothetical protein